MNRILSAKVQNINGIKEFSARYVLKLTFLSMQSGIGEIEKINARPARKEFNKYNAYFYAMGRDVISAQFTTMSDCINWLKSN